MAHNASLEPALGCTLWGSVMGGWLEGWSDGEVYEGGGWEGEGRALMSWSPLSPVTPNNADEWSLHFYTGTLCRKHEEHFAGWIGFCCQKKKK